MSPTLPALRPVVLYQQPPTIQATAKSPATCPAACRRPPLRARYAMPAPPDPPSQDTGPASIREGRGEASEGERRARAGPATRPRAAPEWARPDLRRGVLVRPPDLGSGRLGSGVRAEVV